MSQADEAWQRLARSIRAEDRLEALSHNVRAEADCRLGIALGPVSFCGAIMTAPVVLLLSHPGWGGTSAPSIACSRPGWPLSALHPDAPAALSKWWRERLGTLIERFGAQHIAHAVAAIFLCPWHSERFDEKLRLPSRARMLDLAASAAARDAILVVASDADLWGEHPALASLPSTRRVCVRSRQSAELTRISIGDAWDSLLARIGVHAWI
jgi:hypothetical protein